MDQLLKSELSACTFAALQEHLLREKILNENPENENNEDVQEDFRMSQFWYDDKTATILAEEAMELSKDGPIAFISTPAAFKAMKKLYPERKEVYLFEFDKRFEKCYHDEFVYYNYNDPLNFPSKFKNYFDYVLVDPPYLNENCLSAFSQTMKAVSRLPLYDSLSKNDITKSAIITGAILRDAVKRHLTFEPSGFRPSHSSKISNPLFTYTNYKSDRFGQYIDN